MSSFAWVFGVSCVVAFGVTIGIGANDLANSFGTAYGSKVLTVRQIVVIAGVCEFAGALLLGGEVAQTVGGGIARLSLFDDKPFVYMHGMFSAMIAVAAWLGIATFTRLPVSTTHSTVGGVIGFALAFSSSGVVWSKSHDEFPFVKGVVPIFISWITSPLLSLGVAALTFAVLRPTLLRQPADSNVRAAVMFGLIAFVTFWVNAFFILAKGMKNRVKWPVGQSALVATAIAIFCALVCAAVAPWLLKRSRAAIAAQKDADAEEHDAPLSNLPPAQEQPPSVTEGELDTRSVAMGSPAVPPTSTLSGRVSVGGFDDEAMQTQRGTDKAAESCPPPNTFDSTLRSREGTTTLSTAPGSPAGAPFGGRAKGQLPVDPADPGRRSSIGQEPKNDSFRRRSATPYSVIRPHGRATAERQRAILNATPAPKTGYAVAATDTELDAQAVHEKGRAVVEEFSPVLEGMFRYLQIFTSMVISFAHGANDVSNAVGALAAVYAVYNEQAMPDKVEVPIWMLAGGGFGIVVGLAAFGRIIMKVLGEEMCILTPSRGFIAQFATALVVSLSSSFGLPVSTTHCITGAVIGIGLVDNVPNSIDWHTVGRTTAGWIVTLVVTAGSAAAIFAQAVYAPKA